MHDHRRAQLGAPVLQWPGQPAQQPVQDLVALVGVRTGAAGQKSGQVKNWCAVAFDRLQGDTAKQVDRVANHAGQVGLARGVKHHIRRHDGLAVGVALPHLDQVAAMGVGHVGNLHDQAVGPVPYGVGAVDQREVVKQPVQVAPVHRLAGLFAALAPFGIRSTVPRPLGLRICAIRGWGGGCFFLCPDRRQVDHGSGGWCGGLRGRLGWGVCRRVCRRVGPVGLAILGSAGVVDVIGHAPSFAEWPPPPWSAGALQRSGLAAGGGH